MQRFLQRFGALILGTLCGFDRLRFRGTLRLLANVQGLRVFLTGRDVPLKNCMQYLEGVSKEVRQASAGVAEAAGRPLLYLSSSATDKEEVARTIAQRDHVTDGLIAVLSCVEPCWSYGVVGNKETRHLELRAQYRKCLHYYHYYVHPTFGFLHARLQSWFPFTMHLNLNGREWLAQQLDRAGLAYARRDNCVVGCADFAQAQAFLDAQLRVNWAEMLDPIARQVNPAHSRLLEDRYAVPYYWSVEQSEWASDLLFASPEALAGLYPRLLRHGLDVLSCSDVLRFLGRKTTAAGNVHGAFTGKVTTDLKERPEGRRLKHRLNGNSLKMYDKQGVVLRVETTINDPRDMKVYRTREGDPEGEPTWQRLRKGVADLYRRAQLSQAANDRYLASMATVAEQTPLGTLVRSICQPAEWQGKRVRALNPLASDDALLLQTVARGEFALHGFRNRDLRPHLFGTAPAAAAEIRRQSAAVTRKLRLLRGHGLIQKVATTQRYQLTEQGRKIIAAVLAARQADAAKLGEAA
jgi:hypothetical protein